MSRMLRIFVYVGMLGASGVLLLQGVNAVEPSDKNLEKILADWQKRQNAVKSVRYEVRGERKVPKGAYNVFALASGVRGLQQGQPIPPKELSGDVSLSLFLDFEKECHNCQFREWQFLMNSVKFAPAVLKETFDGKVLKRFMPKEKNSLRGDKAPEMLVVSGNMANGEFLCNCFPIFFGHGRIYTVMKPIIPGKLKNKPDHNYLYVHGTGVHDGRTCLIVRTQTLKRNTTCFDEYWVDTTRESAILRHVSYSGSEPSSDITIRYRKSAIGWLPESWRLDVYSGGLLYSENMRVEKILLDPPVNDADFQMEIEPGMLVEERTDHATKNPLVTPESTISVYRAKEDGGREEVPDPYHRKGDRYQEYLRRKNPWFWSWLTLPFLAIIGFLIWAHRRRRAP